MLALATALGISVVGLTPIGGGATASAAEPPTPEECFRLLPVNGTAKFRSGISKGEFDATPDGRYLVLDYQTNVGGEYGESIMRIDTLDGSVEQVEVAVDGGAPNGGAWGSSISDDGRYVAFVSTSTNLIAGDDPFSWDVFVRDLETDTTERVSVGDNGVVGANPRRANTAVGEIRPTDISADGNIVAFAGDVRLDDAELEGDQDQDIFVRDRAAGTTTRVSDLPDDGPEGWEYRNPVVSSDGSTVAFVSHFNSFLYPEAELYRRVLVSGGVEPLDDPSPLSNDVKSDVVPVLSNDGRYLAYVTGIGVAPTKTVKIYDAQTGVSEALAAGPYQPDRAGRMSMSTDANTVAYFSAAGLVVHSRSGVVRMILHERGETTSAMTSTTDRGLLLGDGVDVVGIRVRATTTPRIEAFRSKVDRAGIQAFRSLQGGAAVTSIRQGSSVDVVVDGHNLTAEAIVGWHLPGVTLTLNPGTQVPRTGKLTVASTADLGGRAMTVTAASGCKTNSLATVTVQDSQPSVTGFSRVHLRSMSNEYVTVSGQNLECPCTVSLEHGIVASSVSSNGSTLGFYAATPATTQDALTDLSITNSFGKTTVVNDAFVVHASTGEFRPLVPARILDTRTGIGGVKSPVGQSPRSVMVAGRGGVPADGQASAVVINVTTTNPGAGSYITVWPSGTTQPLASNLNMVKGQTVANLVTVPIGADGAVNAFVANASAELIFDVVGYYSSGSGEHGGRFLPTEPERLLDTREFAEPIGHGETGRLLFEPSPLSALVLNVTVVNPTSAGYVTVMPAGSSPLASSVNFAPGQTVANLVTVGLGSLHGIDIFNAVGNAHVIIDLVGVYGDGSEYLGDSAFQPLTPTRFLDTRSGFGAPAAPIGAGATLGLDIAGRGGVPAEAAAIAANVTATNPSRGSWLTVWPDGLAKPATSNLNFLAGQTVPNSVVMGLGDAGDVNIANALGQVDVIADVSGWFSPVFMELSASAAASASDAANGTHEPVRSIACVRCSIDRPALDVAEWNVVS